MVVGQALGGGLEVIGVVQEEEGVVGVGCLEAGAGEEGVEGGKEGEGVVGGSHAVRKGGGG